MAFDLVSQDEKNKRLILDFLRSADISLKDIRFQSVKKSVDELDDGLKEFIRKQSLQPTEIFERKIDMIHSRFDSSGKEIGEIRFDVSDEESEGTRNLLRILSPLFLTMYSGGVILVDELDASMHPLILQMILEYFQNPDTNAKNAQLIFNAHDASLMDV
jgi:AAA15 family ATPase/GTPase